MSQTFLNHILIFTTKIKFQTFTLASMWRKILFPFSLVWWLVLSIRHLLYDWNILKSKRASVFTLVIGNLSLGGTGKSPHAIWFIKQINQMKLKTGFLSRGYGRTSQGFQLVTSISTTSNSGDEAKLIANHFNQMPCAVAENRLDGIDQLVKIYPDIDIMVLDDAFQHRALNPHFSVVLFDFESLRKKNYLIPVGNNRDVKWRLKYCDAIIISKSPEKVDENQLKDLFKQYQKPVFVSRLMYANPYNYYQKEESETWKSDKWLFFSGIAKPDYVVNYLKSADVDFISKEFKDHVQFDKQSIEKLQLTANKENRKLLCTEKDWVKIAELTSDNNFWIKNCFVLPVDVYFSPIQEQQLKQLLYARYHSSNQRNS